LELPGLAFEVGGNRVAIALKVFTVDALVPDGWREIVAFDGEKELRALGEIKRAGLQVPLVDSFRRGPRRELITLLALLKRLLDAFQLGDVAGRADHADCAPVAVAQRQPK